LNLRFSTPPALLLACFIFLLTASSIALGQEAARPDRGTMPNRTYSVTDVENISLQNGNVNLSIPLASLPPIAGGKLSWTVSAHYNSKLWNVTREQANAEQLTWAPYNFNTPQISDSSGWRIGGAYRFQFRNANEDFYRLWYPGNSGLPYQELSLLNNNQWYKVVLVMPDGSEHEFRRTDTTNSLYNGSQDYLRGYYNAVPTGSPLRYYSVDGSFLFATISSLTNWTVYMPDGTKAIQSSDGIQRIQDTNGNKIKIFSDEDGDHYQDEQTGREILVSKDSGWLPTQVTYQTVGGTAEHIDIEWGSTTVRGKLWTNNINGCDQTDQLATTTMDVVREIILPATETGQNRRRFSFKYNSDSEFNSSATDTVVWSCPNGSSESYTRDVSSGMGELSQMTTPSGGVVDYSYSLDGNHNFQQFYIDLITEESITQKQVAHDNTSDTWTYQISDSVGTVTGPDGSGVQETRHCSLIGTSCATTKAGLAYRSTRPYLMTERHWINLEFSGVSKDKPGGILAFNAVVDFEYTTLLDANNNALKMSARAFQYDYNGNVTQTIEYDWFDPASVSRDTQGVPTGLPSGATVLRTVNTDYYNPAGSSSSGNVYAKRDVTYGTPLILNATKQVTIGSSVVQLSYDGNSYGTAPSVGNLTNKIVYDDVDNSWITTSLTYDGYGNVATSTDGRGKITTFAYDSSTHAQPTSVTVNPDNGTGTQSVYTAYDYYTGLITSVTDVNGKASTVDYTNLLLNAVDPFGRPGITKSPAVTVNGSSQQQRVTTFYEDHLRRVTAATDLYAENDQLLKTRTTADMLGRPILTEQTEDGTNYTIKAYKAYDIANRIAYSSGPMRSSAALTDSWTRTTSDSAGRITKVATFAGASQPPATGTTSVAGFTGEVSTSYDANFTTVKDQAEKLRRSKTDALGRLMRVDEPNASGSLGSTSEPYQPTCYEYDVLGNLTKVIQGTQLDSSTGRCALSGSQQRTFTYDTLSRLRSAANPESGTTTYAYDPNGNLNSKTDARSITTSFAYDSLNRVTSRSYSDGTPTVTYTYDSSSISNGKGRLASVSSNVSSYSYAGYDATGKVSGGSQTIYGSTNRTYAIGYGYDLAGHVISMSYPSGHTVSYNYDNAGRLADADSTRLAFTGNLGDGSTTPRTYSRGIVYDAGGRMIKEQFGTTTAIYNKLFYNSRGQLSEIRAGTSYNSASDTGSERGAIINFYSDHCWGMCTPTQQNNGSMPDNNGNLLKQQIDIPGSDHSTVQWFGYDSLNRLDSANEVDYLNVGGNPQERWRQSYVYDRFGNRTIDQSSNRTWGNGIPKPNFGVDTNTNRLTVPNGYSGEMIFDSAGNLTKDTYSAAAVSRLYDAENRMTRETQASSYVAGEYFYDGDGRRVKRVVAGVETWQVYGLGGELIAEYAANTAASTPKKEYGYRNGQMLVTATVTGAGWGSAPTFTDDPLNPNGTKTDIKLVHLTELRTAVNQLRSHAGLSSFSFTVDASPTQYVTTVKADHIRQLRTALEQALTALHLPTGGYAHATLTEQSSIIYAADFQELRNQIKAVWSNVTINWLITDQLGTPRMIVDQSGSLSGISRHDYLPYGEELFAGTGGRTSGIGYTSGDSVRQKFTGYEHDSETGLEFAQARYYASIQGRFTSPDPVALAIERLTDPQMINLYAYARNNPLKFVDPSGETVGSADKDSQSAYDNYKKLLYSDRVKYAKEITTLEQLEKSERNYVITLTTKGFDRNAEGYTRPDKDGNITIALKNEGNGSEKLDLNGRMAHELEHGRQFDSGELTFAPDSKGIWSPYFEHYDVGDEVKAFNAYLNVATKASDQRAYPIIRKLRRAENDAQKASYLLNGEYSNLEGRKYGSNYTPLKSLGKQPGEIVRTGQFYGVVNSVKENPKKAGP
jgi:RHS repeat-associated protein